MKYIFLLVILVLVYIAVTYVRYHYILSHANLPAIVQNDQTLGHGPVIRYIAAGDSTALGEGASTVENTYTYKVAQALAIDHQVNYRNIAVMGATTDDMISSQLTQIIAFNPGVITISIGANDATHLHSSKRILQNYQTIINELQAKTSATIYISDIANLSWNDLLPQIYRQILEARSRKINSQILNLANDRVKVINIHDFGWSQYPNLSTTLSADHFHLNDMGYQTLANAFLDQIKNN